MDTYDKIVNIFCVRFLETISNERVLMTLEIPKLTCTEFLDGSIVTDNKVLTRNLNKPDTAKGYAQLFTIAALVAELLQGVKYTCTPTHPRSYTLCPIFQHTAHRTVSLRDVYYSLAHMFSTQQECNSCILDFGRLMGLKRCTLSAILFQHQLSFQQ